MNHHVRDHGAVRCGRGYPVMRDGQCGVCLGQNEIAKQRRP
ncbi:hypothetical protein I549_4147 [Mycobacterium avium subsp. avium 2285 (R)]|nr:hypothetical protein I549_4147 [Mycobacterium avium subsp. avium 2285 (R)]